MRGMGGRACGESARQLGAVLVGVFSRHTMCAYNVQFVDRFREMKRSVNARWGCMPTVSEAHRDPGRSLEGRLDLNCLVDSSSVSSRLVDLRRSRTLAEAQSNNIKSAQIPRPPDCTWHLADGPGVQDPRSGHRRWPTLCTAAGLSMLASLLRILTVRAPFSSSGWLPRLVRDQRGVQ